MHKQIDNYMNDKLSPLLTGFRKNQIVFQQCLKKGEINWINGNLWL